MGPIPDSDGYKKNCFRLKKVEDRIHILEGRQLILLNIDEVIQIIRASDEPKKDLMEAFNLSERQADDILEIRLRQLARLEAIKIEQELSQLNQEKEDLTNLLGNDSVMRRRIIKEIEADSKMFGDSRRTLIQEEKRSIIQTKVIDEPVTVIVSQKGWVRSRLGHGHDPLQFSFKAGDNLYAVFECRTVDFILGMGSNGRVYSVAVSDLPGARGDGVPMTSLVSMVSGTQMVSFYAGQLDDLVLIAMSSGNGFLANVADMVTRNKAGKSFVGLNEKFLPADSILPLYKIRDSMKQVACYSSDGKLLTFDLTELKRLPSGGKGVILMDLGDKAQLLSAICFDEQGLLIEGLGRANKPSSVTLSMKTLLTYKTSRAKKGQFVEPRLKEAVLKPV